MRDLPTWNDAKKKQKQKKWKLFSDDGAPETSELAMSIGSLTCWNFGSRIDRLDYDDDEFCRTGETAKAQHRLLLVSCQHTVPVLGKILKRSQDNAKENSMKVLLYIAIYALLITLCSTKSNSSSNKTPGKKTSFGSRGQSAGGPTGRKGEPGARGIQGPKGTPGYAGALESNWKQCIFKNLDNHQNTGLIKECIFEKTSNETALRVFWNGDFRVANCRQCCNRWYFTFNGAECSTPSAIDGIFVVWNNVNFARNPHRVRHIEGICEKLREGEVRVGFWVGQCVGTSYPIGDAATGFHSVSRIYVEEVSPPQA